MRISIESARKIVRQIKPYYRSGESHIGKDFFLPCLSYCSSYKRAAGFFSSSALITWASILPRLVADRTISIKFLISPQLPEADIHVLEKVTNFQKRFNIIQEMADKIVLDAVAFANTPSNIQLRMKLFLWLVANGHLELRFAFSKHVQSPGPFHEKIGVFDFPWGDKIAFTGSSNESIMGHERNYESLDVYRNWIAADSERVDVKIIQFEDAWSGNAHGLMILTLSETTLSHIRAIAPDSNPFSKDDLSITTSQNVADNKWRHQDDAIREFLKTGRGILEMATGTGKTRTAIKICENLLLNDQIETIIVATDGTDLLNQWQKELLFLTGRISKGLAILCHYSDKHEIDQFILNSKYRILLASRIALPRALSKLNSQQVQKTILIHDEVHGLGSPSNQKNLAGLSDMIRFRLGLSATPDREYDSYGNDFIEKHIGPVVFKFELADAIRRGILAPFNYYPLEYKITEEDRTRLKTVYAKEAARKAEGNPMSKEELWTNLAFVYKTSKGKLPVFNEFIQYNQNLLTRSIIFVETMEYGNEVLDIVHKHNYHFHSYYAGDDSEVLNQFAKDQIKLLITCHRLSEGIDIKSLETVILFSSARVKLETIQRIGRCLRTDPENPIKIANIVDFIRVDNEQETNPVTDQERKLWLIDLSKIRPEETQSC